MYVRLQRLRVDERNTKLPHPRAGAARRDHLRLSHLRIAVTGIALLTIFGGGCSSSMERTPQEQFTQEFIAGAIADAGEFQAEILADGKVDFAEYQRSILAVITCIKEEGLEVRGPPVLEPDGYTYIYFYGVPEGGEAKLSDAQVNGKYNSCYSRFGELVDSVWFAQNAPTMGDASPALKRRFLDCFSENGVDLPDDSNITDIYRAMSRSPLLDSACGDR
jgi:hypothetical protein